MHLAADIILHQVPRLPSFFYGRVFRDFRVHCQKSIKRWDSHPSALLIPGFEQLRCHRRTAFGVATDVANRRQLMLTVLDRDNHAPLAPQTPGACLQPRLPQRVRSMFFQQPDGVSRDRITTILQ
ncbi:MAG: hypothetical protein GC164_15825 [Phycisphaera sp.]|nr:hypothetical protein [Phycisphaera sp.]